jgi:hypothetical protein
MYSTKFSVNIESPVRFRSRMQSGRWQSRLPRRRKEDLAPYQPSELPSSIHYKHSIWIWNGSLWLCILPSPVKEPVLVLSVMPVRTSQELSSLQFSPLVVLHNSICLQPGTIWALASTIASGSSTAGIIAKDKLSPTFHLYPFHSSVNILMYSSYESLNMPFRVWLITTMLLPTSVRYYFL